MKAHQNLDKAIVQQRAWEFYQQYEGAMQPVRDMLRWCQSERVIVHEELFETRRMLELMSLPYFRMYENLSAKRGSERVADLTDRTLNQLVVSSDFLSWVRQRKCMLITISM